MIILISIVFIASEVFNLQLKGSINPNPFRQLQQAQDCINSYKNLIKRIDYKTIESQTTPWIDPDFPQSKALASLDDLKFVSASSKNFVKIFGDQGIKVSDIKQGYLGNCYLLSVIQSLAQYPQLIEKLFVNKQNTARIYVTEWYLGGNKVQVAIDDRFALNSRGLWDHSKIINDDELWPLILEKAWAKMSGNFVNTQGGWPTNVFHSVTGAPVTQYRHSSYEHQYLYYNVFNFVNQWKFPINVSTLSNKCKITNGHSFSLLGAYSDVLASDGQLYNLIKIRNPHNGNMWEGEFSDSSALWTEDLKTLYGVGSDPGVFFMDSKTYYNCFDYTIVNHVVRGYDNYYVEFNNVTQVSKRFNITQGGEFAVSVYFISQRFLDQKNQKCQSPRSRSLLQLYQVDSSNNQKKFIAQTSEHGLKGHIAHGQKLNSAEYQVKISVVWKQSVDYIRIFQLNVYANEQISFADIPKITSKSSSQSPSDTSLVSSSSSSGNSSMNLKIYPYLTMLIIMIAGSIGMDI